MNKSSKPRIVVLGGGTGTSVLLKSLLPKLEAGQIESLHALVHMADDGGSTGRLRDQYGVAAMGDLTKCLVALSSFQGDIRGDEFLRALDYRFSSGDFEGHTLRNTFLTSLEKTSDLDTAIATMARILQIPKASGVVPTTLTPVTQQVSINFNDGQDRLLGQGQHSISHQVNFQADPRWEPGDIKVGFAEHEVALNPRAQLVLEAATHYLVAPGHTYGTILPTLALPSLQQVVGSSTVPLTVVMTLLTTAQQTAGWSGEDFVRVYESYLRRPVAVVLANSGRVDVELVAGQGWVEFGTSDHSYTLLLANLVSSTLKPAQAGDVVPRAIVVHDSVLVGKLLDKVLLGKTAKP